MKKLTFFIIIILIFGGFLYFLFRNNSQNVSRNGTRQDTVTPTVESDLKDNSSVLEATEKFYKYYEDCMKNPPSEASGKVGEYCQDNSGMTTSDFKTNLEKGGTAKAGADPIVCAQDFPENITVNPNIQIRNNEAKVQVNGKFGPKDINILVSLKKEIDTWKIDNILCPLP